MLTKLGKLLYIFISVVLIISMIAPVIDTYNPYIRAFDFPRLQIAIFSLLFIAYSLLRKPSSIHYKIISFLVFIGLCFDAYRIIPYSPIYPTESKFVKKGEYQTLKIYSANVFINNREYSKTLKEIKALTPDIVLLMEPDQEWEKGVESLDEIYPYSVKLPLDNTYGMILYSKLKLMGTRIKYLIDKNVPSIFTSVQLGQKGKRIELICLHPRAPRPSEGTSLDRDGALIQVAKYIRDNKEKSVLVIGDFNDVAWSHTTRRFKRLSMTLDPRVGRGMYNTFPVSYPFIRFPLDHIFHTPDISLVSLELQKDIGSDHFPIFAEFTLEKKFENIENATDNEPKVDDFLEAKDVMEDSKEYKEPKKEVNKAEEKPIGGNNQP